MSQELDPLFEILKTHPEDFSIRSHLVTELIGQGRTGEAADVLRAAPKQPDSASLDQMFESLAATSPETAAAYAAHLVGRNFKSAQAHLWKARLHAVQGQTTDAAKHYKLAQVMAPGTFDQNLENIINPPVPVVTPPPVVEAATVVQTIPVAEESSVIQTAPAQDPTLAPVGVVRVAPLRPPVVEAEPAPVTPEIASVATAVAIPAAATATDVAAPEYVPESGVDDYAGEQYVEAIPSSDIPIAHARKRGSDAKQAAAATTLALLIHAAVVMILVFIAIKISQPPPPEINAVIAPMSSESTEIQKKTVVQSKVTKPSAVDSSSTPLVTSNSASQISVPSLPNVVLNDNVSLGTSVTGSVSFGGGPGAVGVPIAMKSRCSPSERLKMLRDFGGSTKIEDSVRNSLLYLQKTQNADGSWGKSSQSAFTGFALLCFLGRCETAESQAFGDTVFKGTMWLVSESKKNNGLLASGANRNYIPYEHGIACYGLGETYALAKYGKRDLPGVREAFEKGVEIILDSQTKRGGWAYGYDKGLTGDLSVTGWNYQALKAAKHTNLKFTQLGSTMKQAKDYIESLNGPQGGFGYNKADDKLSLTAAGALGLQLLGQGNRPKIEGAMQFLHDHYTKNPPDSAPSNLYEWYYNTQLFFNAGGDDWKWWNGIFMKRIMDLQKPDGSFSPGREDHNKSPLYNTALCTLMLEVYYRYLPATSSH